MILDLLISLELLKTTTSSTQRQLLTENAQIFHLLQQDVDIANLIKQFNFFRQRNYFQNVVDIQQSSNMSFRSIERMFNRNVVMSAISNFTLDRFHQSTSQLIGNHFDKLSDMAYEKNYFDQMHIIREFNFFSGESPQRLMRSTESQLQRGTMT
jgi:hypothetical protein